MLSSRITAFILCSATLLTLAPAHAQTTGCRNGKWTITNRTETIRQSVTRACDIVIGTNGRLVVTNRASLRVSSSYDEEHSITIQGNGVLRVSDARIRAGSNGSQYYIALKHDGVSDAIPLLDVSGPRSVITEHTGIRAYGRSRVIVTGGDVEEVAIHDQAHATVRNATVYPAFYPGPGANMAISLKPGSSVSTTVPSDPTADTFRFELENANLDSGFQIDAEPGADITVRDSTNVVLAIRTPGDLGDDTGGRLRVLDRVTGPLPYSRRFDDLGAKIGIENSQIELLNVYTFGKDRVLVRNSWLNEINADGDSELIIAEGSKLVANLAQAYGRANIQVVNATMEPDYSGHQPSVTTGLEGDDGSTSSTFRFANVDLRGRPGASLPTHLEAINDGLLQLDNSPHDPNELEGAAEIRESSAHFAPSALEPQVQETVSFVNLAAGEIRETYWDFGDNAVSSEHSPEHIYTQPGTYAVRMTIVDAAGRTDTATRNVTVRP